uniref:Uncharacterized protein n=1 Tax=Siphoviridae sp. ctTnV63 TaxID=2825523 RepID=A0A8S5NV58_9CAUD|nr:MAG TPA: hypothetical protein [Siphoviridae sp. ctTnV63]
MTNFFTKCRLLPLLHIFPQPSSVHRGHGGRFFRHSPSAPLCEIF